MATTTRPTYQLRLPRAERACPDCLGEGGESEMYWSYRKDGPCERWDPCMRCGGRGEVECTEEGALASRVGYVGLVQHPLDDADRAAIQGLRLAVMLGEAHPSEVDRLRRDLEAARRVEAFTCPDCARGGSRALWVMARPAEYSETPIECSVCGRDC